MLCSGEDSEGRLLQRPDNTILYPFRFCIATILDIRKKLPFRHTTICFGNFALNFWTMVLYVYVALLRWTEISYVSSSPHVLLFVPYLSVGLCWYKDDVKTHPFCCPYSAEPLNVMKIATIFYSFSGQVMSNPLGNGIKLTTLVVCKLSSNLNRGQILFVNVCWWLFGEQRSVK